MPDIDVVDSTWIDVSPASLAPVLADATNWRRWWPDLVLTLDEARGVKGVRWFVVAGPLAGSMEVWLQPIDDGTVLHYFLRLDAPTGPLVARDRERVIHQHRLQTKRAFWALSDRLDPGRLARVAAPRTDR